MIALPPSLPGAVHVSVTLLSPAAPVGRPGAPGTAGAAGVTGSLAADWAPVPTLFVAATLKV